ncbi:hypothetical protein PRIPAC_92605, partial [Pristionchus pacificus]
GLIYWDTIDFHVCYHNVVIIDSGHCKRNNIERKAKGEPDRSAMRDLAIVLIGAVLLVLYSNKIAKEEEARRAAENASWLEQRLRGKMRENENTCCIANLFSAVVNNAVGVFKQVNTVGEPIYKHVSGGALGMRQINTMGQAIYKPSWFGSTSQFVGKASSFIALAINGVTVLEAVSEDYRRGPMHNTICSMSKAAGGYYGAAYGAATGATVLSFVPLVGPLAGGFIGGSLGMVSGTSIGGFVAEVITETPEC